MRPVSERIALVLFDRLQELAAQLNPNTVVSEVIRPTRMGDFTPKHNQIVMVQDDPVIDPVSSHPGNPPAIAWLQRFKVHCHVMPSEQDPTTLDELLNTFVADVIKTVTVPQAGWHNMDGLAINTTIEGFERIPPDGSFAGMTIVFAVLYRTDETSPYVVRA